MNNMIEYSRNNQSDELEPYDNLQYIYILLSGKVNAELKQQNNILQNTKNNQQIRKKISTQTLISATDNIAFIDECNFNTLQTLTHIQFLKIPRKAYYNLISCLNAKNIQINIQFLSQHLSLDPYDVKVHKLHKIPYQRFNNNPINLSQLKGLAILRKGQCKVIWVSKQNKEYQTIITPGNIVNNMIFCELQKCHKIKQIKPFKQCSLILIPEKTVQILFSEINQLKQKTISYLKNVNKGRQKYLRDSIQPIEQQIYYLKQPIKGFKRKYNKNKKHSSSHEITLTVNKVQNEDEWNNPGYEFITYYQYDKMIESKKIVLEKKKNGNKKKRANIAKFLQLEEQRKKQEIKKMLKLKMRTMAQKSIRIDKKSLDATISNSQNWFKRGLFQCDYEEQDENFITASSTCSKFIKNQMCLSDNDTGLINDFSKNSHSYRKEINHILKHNKAQSILKGDQKVYSSNRFARLLKSYQKGHKIQAYLKQKVINNHINLKPNNLHHSKQYHSKQFSNFESNKQSQNVTKRQNKTHPNSSALQRQVLHRSKSGKIIRVKVHKNSIQA